MSRPRVVRFGVPLLVAGAALLAQPVYVQAPSAVADQQAGIRIGSAVDGSLKAFIKAPAGATRVAESVAVDVAGNIYGGRMAR